MEAPTRATKEEPSVRRNQEHGKAKGRKQVKDTVLMMPLVKKGERWDGL